MEHAQHVPVRLYTADDRIMVAAPLPGLEPQNIAITIDGDRVVIHGELRGPRQEERALLLDEWTVGPYERELTLPQPVSGALTNATYGNGVLVLAMPILTADQQRDRVEFTLEAIAPTHGERVGHAGKMIRPTTTEEHRRQVADTAARAGEPHDHHTPEEQTGSSGGP